MRDERAVRIECTGEQLVGIAHIPDGDARVGVLVIVGGPQYRIGSHRQFVLLSRYLAQEGVAAFRFDYRGIGDGSGPARDFLSINDDIKSAVDAFERECPGLEEIYLWGLCDAASAALFYGHRDKRIAGLVLCNPWVRTESTYARTIVKTYYMKQLVNVAFWQRLLAGKLDVRRSLQSLAANLRASLGRGANAESRDAAQEPRGADQFPAEMLAGLNSFKGRVLLILSGNDLTAAEFDTLFRTDRDWTNALRKRRAVLRRLPEANHTFSTRAWRDQVATWTAQWVRDPRSGSDAVIT